MGVGKGINLVKRDEERGGKKKPGRKPGVKAIPDAVFFTCLRQCGGLFSQTAELLSKVTGNPYTRSAVHQRANHHPEILKDIEEAELDKAEAKLREIMKDDLSADTRTNLDATKFYLKTKGKGRGYVERSEVTGAEGKDLPAPVIQVIMPKVE